MCFAAYAALVKYRIFIEILRLKRDFSLLGTYNSPPLFRSGGLYGCRGGRESAAGHVGRRIEDGKTGLLQNMRGKYNSFIGSIA